MYKMNKEEHEIIKNDKIKFNFEYLERRKLTITEELSKSEIKVLGYCLSIQNEKEFKFNKTDCEQIEIIFNLKYQLIKKALENLIKKDIIFKITKGCYKVHSSLQYIKNLTNYKLELKYDGDHEEQI